jgi:predicted acyltransferase
VHEAGMSVYDDLLEPVASPQNASLLFAFIVLLLVYAVILWMHRRRWYLKF